MLLVSMLLFLLLEVGGRDVTQQILGVFSTPEQRESLRNQLGYNQPAYIRYSDWLLGNDWRLNDELGNLTTTTNDQTRETEWWVELDDGRLVRHRVDEGQIQYIVRQEDGSTEVENAGDVWVTDPATGERYFWGISSDGFIDNSAARWVEGSDTTATVTNSAGTQERSGAAEDWIPLRKGLVRGDAGVSLQFSRPVSATLPSRIRNTAILAGVAFVIVMPLALVLGIFTGINEGKFVDRFISVTSLALTATPEFVTGIFLILLFGVRWKILPAIAAFDSPDALLQNPLLIALPVLTLTAVELGYITRMTRASMVEVMQTPYIRTAIIKGMPFWRVVFRHAVRNALMAPITIIMLHINYLVGGVVVVEVIFGYPGLGQFIYDAAIFGDPNSVEAAAMVTVLIAVATRLLGDLAYTLLNPRIRFG